MVSKRKNMGSGSDASRKKAKKSVKEGVAYVSTTFNNIIVTITGPSGETLTSSSAGAHGFRGAKKSTPFAATQVALDAAQRANAVYGMDTLTVVNVKGPGAGRDSAVRALRQVMKIRRLRDTTPIPHNGCRPSKKRRV